MGSWPLWLELIFRFFLSGLFEQLVGWAKEIVGAIDAGGVVDKDLARVQAVTLLRSRAELDGYKVGRWQAGQAVEAAYAELHPDKARVVG